MKARSRTKTVIRSITSTSQVPSGNPRRYVEGRGYVRLRWKVGTNAYAEAYEHRLVKAFPAADVHHQDGNKANNAPENLEPLGRVEHAKHHGGMRTARSRRMREWGGARSQRAFERRNRRIQRERERRAFVARMVDLYASGLSTIEVGKQVGLSASNVLLALRKAGVEIRTTTDYGPKVDRQAVARMHAEGVRAAEMMRRLGIGRQRLYSIFDELELPRFTGGRPPKRQTYSPNHTNQPQEATA